MSRTAYSHVSSPASRKRALICFSHLRWNFVYQRPQHLLSRAARAYDVFFFEEPRYEAGLVEPRLQVERVASGVTVAVPVLAEGTAPGEAALAQRALLDELVPAARASRAVAWYYTPMALAFSDHLAPDLCVYDCMDELSAFRGAPPELRALEKKLFDRADLVFTGGRSLYEAKRGRHPSVHAFASSIDRAHFGRAREIARGGGTEEPADQAGLPRPRLGYFGVVDERMDLDLVAETAALRPDWQFVMIGPVVKIDPAELPRRENIHWLGSKSYDVLPEYLASWDVGLMPFALDESTRFISPTKTPEFLAAGVPVVSTAVRDVVRPYGEARLVEIAGGAREVVARAEAIMARQRAPWLERVDAHLAGMSWDDTFARMNALMSEILEAREPQRTVRERPSGQRPRALTAKGSVRV